MARILFYTCIYTPPHKAPQDEPGKFKRIKGCDYLCLTNCDWLDQAKTDWTLVRSKVPAGMRPRIFSRMVKFNPWKYIPNVEQYDMLVYMDVMLSPKTDDGMWPKILGCLDDHDLMIEDHWCPNMRHQLKGLAGARDTPERMERTAKWLEERGVDLDSDKTPRYSNKFFGLKPGNKKVRKAFLELCEFLAADDVTHRDQPPASYIYPKHKIKTHQFKTVTGTPHTCEVSGWRSRDRPGRPRIHPLPPPPPPPPAAFPRKRGVRVGAVPKQK